MTGQRTFVTFEANLPDDSVFTDSGDIIVPRGRHVCEKLVQGMRSAGITVTDPEQHEFYGWEFTANLNGAETWMLLQGVETWLLILEDRSGESGWFLKANDPSIDSLRLIDDTLKSRSNFENVSWFNRKEYETGARVGSPVP
jgi:hypothetical protein